MLAEVFALLIPTATVAEAGDIPEFLQVLPAARNYARYTGVEDHHKGRRWYHYEWNVNLRENFGEQYVQILKRNGCTVVDHRVDDWRRVNAQYIDVWILRFRGQKFEVWRYKYFNEGRTSFSVVVPYSLTYGG